LPFQFGIGHPQRFCALSDKFFQQFLRSLQFFFSPLALHELPDLAANAGEHFQNAFVRLADLAAEEFQHSDEVLSEKNRKRESTVKTLSGRNRSARKIIVFGNIRDPCRFQAAPHTSRQANTAGACEIAGCALEFGKPAGMSLPHLNTAQRIATGLQRPEITYFPPEGLTNRPENSPDCVRESGRFRKNPRHGKIDGCSLFGGFSIGNLGICFKNLSRRALRIAIERPPADDNNFGAVFASMNEF